MTAIVGICNVTPDSFAETGARTDPDRAVAHAETLIADGADVVDVGAESTRPGATLLAPEDEWARLAVCLPRIVARAHACGVAVSVDTRHPETARRSIDAGVDWINDVSGGSAAMAATLAGSTVRLVVMHNVSIPADPARRLPVDADPVAEVSGFLDARIAVLEAAGVPRARLIVDPGFGFGKSPAQQMQMVARIDAFDALSCPLLVGHSRKSFLSLFTEQPAPERDDVTCALSGVLIARGVDYLRVHNVARHAALLSALAVPARAGASSE